MGVKNEQTEGFAPLVSQRQDRGTVIADGGEFAWNAFVEKIGGNDLTVTGASTFHIGSGNLNGALVHVGDTLKIAAGPNVGTYYVLSVDGNQDATIDGVFPSTPDGTGRSYSIGSGKLTWTEIISVFVPGLGKHTIAAGSAIDVFGPRVSDIPRGLFVDVNRDAAAALTLDAREVDDTTLLSRDTRIMLGVRGEDDRLYLIDGTVINDGDTRALGTFGNATIDRGADLGDGVTTHYSTGFDYVMGVDQLYVEVGGIGLTVGVDYTEADDNLDTKGDAVDFTTAPGSGEVITFINLAGGQGPQGPAGGQTLQEAYDGGGDGAGRSVAVSASKPVEIYEDGTTGTETVLQVGTSADKTKAKLRSDGQLTLQELRLADGSGNYWSLKGSGGNLVLKHEGTTKEVVFDDAGGLFTRLAGTAPTGSTGDGVQIAEYAGTLTDEAVTTVATGIVGIKGVLFALEDAGGDRWVGEMNLSSSTTRTVVVTYDPATGDVVISGDVAKTAEPGEEYQTRDYTLLVFY